MDWSEFRSLANWILKGPRSLLLPEDAQGLSQWYEKRLQVRRVIGPSHKCTTRSVYLKAQPLPSDAPAIIRCACCELPILSKSSRTDVEPSAAIRVSHRFCSQHDLNEICQMFSALKDIAGAKLLSPQDHVPPREPRSIVRELDVASFLFAVNERSISIEGVFVSCFPEIEQSLQSIEKAFENLIEGESIGIIERYASEPWGDIWDVRSDELADFPNQLMRET